MKQTPKSAGVILAGGASRRMGRDKLLLEVDGVPLLRRVYDTLASRCQDIVVVGVSVSPIPGVRCVPDLRPGREGPLAGIEAGLVAARNDLVFVAAGDMPFLPEELVASLLRDVDGDRARVAVPYHGGRAHPLCAAYCREVLADLSFCLNLGVRAAHTFLESLDGVQYVRDAGLAKFGDPELLLMNVNSPADLEQARKVSRP